MTWAGSPAGDANGLRREQHRDRRQRRRTVREMESDRRLHDHRFATGQQVELQHEIGAGIERPGDLVREGHRRPAGRPAQEVTGGKAGVVEHQTVVTRIGIFRIEFPRCTSLVQQDAGMVDHAPAAGARPQLDGAHPAPGIQIHGQDEVAIDIGVARRQPERLRRGHDEVRRSELPAVPGPGRLREVGPLAFGRAGRRPPGQQGDLFFRQPSLVAETAMTGDRFPGRHPPLGGGRGDLHRPRPGVRVGGQTEGTDAAGTVAADTVGVEDRRNITCERHGAAVGFALCEADLGSAAGSRHADDDDCRRRDTRAEPFVSRPGTHALHRAGHPVRRACCP